jgi:hypothetical protein
LNYQFAMVLSFPFLCCRSDYFCICSSNVFQYANPDDNAQPSSAGIVSWIRGIIDFTSAGVDIVVAVGLLDAAAEAAVQPGTVRSALHCFIGLV